MKVIFPCALIVLVMFSPLFSFLAGLLLFVPGSTDTVNSEILGTWEDLSISGHQIEFFLEGDQLFASSSLFLSPKLSVFQQDGQVIIQDAGRRISGNLGSNLLILHLEQNGTVERLIFEKPAILSGSMTANSESEPTLSASSLGMIRGFPLGRARSTASIFRVFLFQGNQMISSQVLDSENGFVFSQLPNGSYTVLFEPQGPTAIQPIPAFKMITVQNGDVIEANVVLE